MNETDLTHRTTIASVVATWNESERDVRHAYELLAGVQDRLTAAFGGKGRYFEFDHHDPSFASYRDPDRAIESLELRVWNALVDRLELRKLLSLAATRQLDEMTEHRRGRRRTDDTLGPITVENVSNIVRGMLAAIPDQLNIAVREVYDMLRPHCSRLKTNSKFEVGSKVIIEHVGGRVYGIHCSAKVDMLRAIDRVFHMLDGKGLVPATHYGELVDAIDAAAKAKTNEGETQFFRFRLFRNGNLHVWFTRADLLLRFNQLAGGGQLKPAA